MENDDFIFNAYSGCYELITKQKNKYKIATQNVFTPLGKGQFGKVYKATDANLKDVAIKVINKQNSPQILIDREIKFMLAIPTFHKRSNIIHAIEVDQTYYKAYIILPYADKGNLTDFIKSHQIKSEQECIEYFRQICYGVWTLHKEKIIHRDIKTDNILINNYSDPYYKYKYFFMIADIGIAR